MVFPNGMVGQVEMFMSIFKMLQSEVVRSGNGTLSFMDFERLFEDDHVRSFFQVSLFLALPAYGSAWMKL